MSAFLFVLIIEWLLQNVTEHQRTDIRWTLCTKLEDLEFADDIALPSHTRAQIQHKSVEEKVVVIHRGRCNNKVYYRLSHDVVT